MKVKLFTLAALILLSSINGIFFNLPTIGVSAQAYETVIDYNTKTNEMVEDDYSYDNDNPSKYKADDSYSNDAYGMNQEDSEYSTYNSYEPIYSTGNEETEYSSYDNYEYSSNNEYTQDDYSSTYQDDYSDKSYDKNYYPPKEPKKFTCPDSGIVVDKEENCPLICPTGTDLEGHLVAAGSNLQLVCDEDTAQFETCGAGTDLEGVLVTNAPADCNIFATCDANDPLGQALDLTGSETVEVADPQLCDLTVPEGVDLLQCPEGSNLGEGALVTDIDLCNAATPAEQCPDGTTLEGVWVHPAQIATCDIEIPPPVPTETCPEGTPLAGAVVTDIRLCQFEDIELFTCEPGTNNAGALVTDERLCEAPNNNNICPDETDLAGVYVTDPTTECDLEIPEFLTCPEGTNNENAIVTDIRLCQAPNDANLCPAETDLEGVYVEDPATDCDIDVPIATNPEIQCIKCADLAIVFAGGEAQDEAAARALIGVPGSNVFTVCDAPPFQAEFAARIATSGLNTGQQAAVNAAFNACLINAPTPPAPTSAAQTLSLQEKSFTTNVLPEAGISTFSPPSPAQGTEDLTALEKISKLKAQWMEQRH